MASQTYEIFEDQLLIEKIQKKLPYLFSIADKESSRGGKPGMEVGAIREKALVALLQHKFGETNVDTNIPANEKEADARLFGYPISVKTITMKTLTGTSGVKACWTVDADKSIEFCNNYLPRCDILLAQIKWDLNEMQILKAKRQMKKNNQTDTSLGGLFLITLETQIRIIQNLGNKCYLKLPKKGTNPRGIEFTSKAMSMLLNDPQTKYIPIIWKHTAINYNPYKRWVNYWEE